MPKCPWCGSTAQVRKWMDSIEKPGTHSFYFADAVSALSQKTLKNRRKISADRSEPRNNWLLLAGCQEQNFHYIILSGFCQEEIEEKIKKVFFTKSLTNRAVCDILSLSRGDREHLSRTGKDFGLTQETTRRNGRCKFQSSKKMQKTP